jgi:beta-galactosidase
MQSVPAGMTVPIAVGGTVANPHLWNGLTDPYVYHANVIVKNGPLVTDAIVQPFGFRTYKFDATSGFSLNGKPYRLQGVALHQDHHDEGDQFSFKDVRYLADIVSDFDLLREIGANVGRAAHDQHSDFEYSMADYRGIAWWAENALVNRISQNCATDCTAFVANTTQQFIELIRQNFNHPAILFWSVGNEVLLEAGPDPTPVIQALVNTAKAEDTTRMSIYAANAGTETNNLVWLPQATCFNEYFGWYYGKVVDFGGWADAVHAAHPQNPMGLSEYGAGANPAFHGLPIQETGTNRTSTFQTEEYQAFFHEQYWPQILARPWMGITTVWNMFDFASDYRNEGNEPGLNTKGLVTFDRSTKKDAFYYYKAQWSPSPVTYITSRRYTALPQASTTIKVYSNQPMVALTLNGKDLGMQTGTNNVFQWTNVSWVSGPNRASVKAPASCTSSDPTACSDQVTWTN